MPRPLLFLVLLLLVALTTRAALVSTSSRPKLHKLESYTFARYVKDFHKRYSAEEYARREAVFARNLEDVIAHNRAGRALYTRGINHMSDWTSAELQRLNGARPIHQHMHHKKSSIRRAYKKFSRHMKTALPDEVDYRSNVPSILTAVKNQGHCGSCWAHSATEAIESHNAIKTGMLFALSQQQISACTPNPRHCGGSGGCYGSVEALAFEYIHDAGGITEEWIYPYTQYYGENSTCRRRDAPVVQLKGYVSLPSNDQDALMEALVRKGPIAVSVDASTWSSYESGIFDGCTYANNRTSNNHAVQLVGYGHDEDLQADYWVIRNSWSPSWGDHGFIRLLRTKEPECGWNVNTRDGSACDGDPLIAWTCGMCGILYDSTYPLIA